MDQEVRLQHVNLKVAVNHKERVALNEKMEFGRILRKD
jgi:hypothetical protein